MFNSTLFIVALFFSALDWATSIEKPLSEITPAVSTASTTGPYETRIFESGTTFAEEQDGVWQLIDCTGDGIPDLVFIKTRNTGTGRIEVHIASADSSFQTRILEVGTTFVEEENGVWQMAAAASGNLPDLVYMKTRNTGTDSVEVHIASGRSQYQSRTLEVGTTFAEEDDGTWQMIDFDGDGVLDLVFIKTSNTGTGTVEVHVASGSSSYRQRILETGTTFYPETDGVWALAHYTHTVRPDLVFIKTSSTGTGSVEVHVASGASTYQSRILEVGTTFSEESNGPFSLVDYNRDGILDLVYIKDQDTGTGTVEVHVAEVIIERQLQLNPTTTYLSSTSPPTIATMPAYNSIFNDEAPAHLIGNFPLLPLRTKVRGPAYTLPFDPSLPASRSPDPDSESFDALDEVLDLFRANTFFRNFEIRGPADRLLIYGILWISECLGKVRTGMSAREAQKEIQSIALDSNFAIPGDPGFPLNQMFEGPRDRQEAETLRQYLSQVRQELAGRLLARIYEEGGDGRPSKWWLSFTKRKFMGKSL
ncbi:hypothetical protein B7494_g7672 [Chlorociboria aeruginascens]|nr:hypothetical protein B7494_g7672 [Chlorociboria aeruginascens]